MVGPVISELAQDYDGKIVVGKCDVEENDDVAMEYGVRNIPTILFFKNGELVDRFVGAANKATFDGYSPRIFGDYRFPEKWSFVLWALERQRAELDSLADVFHAKFQALL